MHTTTTGVLLAGVLAVALLPTPAAAQFRDDFEGSSPRNWACFTGDGRATSEFRVTGGVGVLTVDATKDRDNIWWALIKRDVAASLDVARLARPGHELRVEARVRLHEAPRRVHLQANTQRTTNFHLNLREYDLPDTLWHTISMTTRRLDARPGDSVNIELGFTDAGHGHYRVDVDYMRADVVALDSVTPDLGEPLVYQPPPAHADPAQYAVRLAAAQSAIVDEQFPEINFAGWHATEGSRPDTVLSVGGTRDVILRWDLSRFAGRRAAGMGTLELTTHHLQLGPADLEEYGQVRVFEILGGDPAWQRATITLERLLGSRPLEEVVNPQVLIDARVAPGQGARTRIVISRAVLQRLLDGRTRGLLLRGLGPVDAGFYAGGERAPRLDFDLAVPGSRGERGDRGDPSAR
jgi:hypothetical protein